MKRKRHKPEQIIRKLREADRMLSEGKDIALVCQAMEVCEATFHRWRNQYGGMKANEAKGGDILGTRKIDAAGSQARRFQSVERDQVLIRTDAADYVT